MQGRAERQSLPFALQALQGLGTGAEFGEGVLGDALSTQNFGRFLEGGGGSLGGSLRESADCLRTPAAGGQFSAAQEALRGRLLGPEGSIGSDLFNPLIQLIQQAGTGDSKQVRGFGVSDAIGRALRNQFADDPTRFQTATGFLDAQRGQGLF